MSDMNNWVASGRLGDDPKYAESQDGKGRCNGSIACKSRYQTKDGQWADKTVWINFTIWGGLAGLFHKMYRKGESVCLMGEYSSRKDDQGRVWSSMNVREFLFKDKKRHDSDGGTPSFGASEPAEPKGFDDMLDGGDLPF